MNRRRHLVLVSLACWLAAACVPSGYMPANLFGGFREHWYDDDTVEVDFGGNGYTDVARARDFAVLRAAELCLERNWNAVHIREMDAEDRVHHSIGYGTVPATTTVTPHARILADCVNLPHPRAYGAREVQMRIRDHYELDPAPGVEI